MVTLRTLGVRELLAGSDSHGAAPTLRIPRHIDYLSLDVEGQVFHDCNPDCEKCQS